MTLPRSVNSGGFAIATVVFIGLLPLISSPQNPSLLDHLLYVIGLVAFFFLPGIAILGQLHLRLNAIELALLGLVLGIAASNFVYATVAWAGVPSLYLAWPVMAFAWFVIGRSRRPRSRISKRVALAPNIGVWLVALICVLPLSILPTFTSDFVALEDGTIQFSQYRDGLLHVSVTNELAHSFPPQAPFLAGRPLTYHYGMELVAVVFHRFLGIAASDVCIRLLPALYLGLVVLAAYSLGWRWLGSAPIALITSLLIVLGEDFSYIPGLLLGGDGIWIADYFQVPSIYSLYLVNPLAPAIALLFSGLLCLSRGLIDRRNRNTWLGVAALLFAVMGTFKIFLILHVMATLLVMALLSIRREQGYFSKAFLATSVACVIVVAPMLVPHERTTVIEVVPELFGTLLPSVLERLELAEFSGFRMVGEMFAVGRPSAGGVAVALFLALPLFIVGSFGVRSVGIPLMLGALCSRKSVPPIRIFLSLFVILGCAMTLLLRVTPVDFPKSYNNSVWFFVQSKLVAWIFVGEALKRLFRRRSRSVAVAGMLTLVLVSMPGAVNFFIRMSDVGSIRVASRDTAEVVEYLAQEAPRGAVVLPGDTTLAICLLAMAPVRVPYLKVFIPSFVPIKDIREYERELQLFWRDWGEGDFRAVTAAKLEVDYVVALSPHASARASFSNDTYHVYPIHAFVPPADPPRERHG
jgi:hypothetical protein